MQTARARRCTRRLIRAEGPWARALLEQHDDLAGIYNIGGGAEGIGRALKEAGADRKIVFIGHGLMPDTRALLIDGTMDAVITQNPQGAVMNCVRIFCEFAGRAGADEWGGDDAESGDFSGGLA